MNIAAFALLEALALIGVPAIAAVCLRLIVRDARNEKERRLAEFDRLRAETRERFNKSMSGYVRRVGGGRVVRARQLDEFFGISHGVGHSKWGKWETGTVVNLGTVDAPRRSAIRRAKEWRQ
jgi:hypothetical protein